MSEPSPNPASSAPSALPPPTLVQDARTLRLLVSELAHADEIAVDTEADSFFSYREKVCLIQITADRRDWLVDPLAGLDLAPLGDFLADPSKRKVFHDGEFDVLILKRTYGFRFANLFDTRVAAGVMGMEAPGLGNVIKRYFDIELDKSMQRSDWRQRPLTAKQVDYARLDTHFLVELMHRQLPELREMGRLEIVDGECARLERLEPVEQGFDPDEFAKLKGARELSPIERTILRELFIVRHEIAHETDQPLFRVINNESLLALARVRPRHAGELARIPGFTSKQIKRLGHDVLDAIRRGEELAPLVRLPRVATREGIEDFDDVQRELHERLKEWRKLVAQRMNAEAAYVFNRHVLRRVVEERPRALEDLERIEGFHAWQVDQLGPDLLELLATFEREERAGKLPVPRRRRGPS